MQSLDDIKSDAQAAAKGIKLNKDLFNNIKISDNGIITFKDEESLLQFIFLGQASRQILFQDTNHDFLGFKRLLLKISENKEALNIDKFFSEVNKEEEKILNQLEEQNELVNEQKNLIAYQQKLLEALTEQVKENNKLLRELGANEVPLPTLPKVDIIGMMMELANNDENSLIISRIRKLLGKDFVPSDSRNEEGDVYAITFEKILKDREILNELINIREEKDPSFFDELNNLIMLYKVYEKATNSKIEFFNIHLDKITVEPNFSIAKLVYEQSKNSDKNQLIFWGAGHFEKNDDVNEMLENFTGKKNTYSVYLIEDDEVTKGNLESVIEKHFSNFNSDGNFIGLKRQLTELALIINKEGEVTEAIDLKQFYKCKYNLNLEKEEEKQLTKDKKIER